MCKLIRVQTTSGNDVLINTHYIQSVMADLKGIGCTVYLAGGVEADDFYRVTSSMDEIEAMVQQVEAKENT